MKNIVFILTDQQHFRTLKANGCPEARTPNLDRLAAEGLNFTNHMVTNPVCSPSRGSIWTGRMPSETGLYGNGCRLPVDTRTVVHDLNDAGYRTAHFGKMHLVPCLNRLEPHPRVGFQEFLCGEGDQWLLHDDYNNWFRCNHPMDFLQHYTKMIEEGYDQPHTARIREEHTHNAWVTRHAASFMDSQRGSKQPFFLSLGYFDPHHAFNPCEPYASMWQDAEVSEPIFSATQAESMPSFMRQAFSNNLAEAKPDYLRRVIRAYHAMMTHIDDCVGSLLERLQANGQLANTLIVFSSDHGEFLGNHGRLFKGGFLMDDLLRVPLMVWDGDAAKRKQGRVDEVTSGVDFVPTFQRMAGVDTAPDSRPLLNAELDVFPEGTRGYAISEWRVHPIEAPKDNVVSVRTRDARLTVYGGSDEGELYLHDSDPYELRNHYADPKQEDRREQLRDLLESKSPPPGDWPVSETLW